MREPGIIHINSLAEMPWPQTEIGGRMQFARPEPYSSAFQRWRAAWLVWRGKADALVWHRQ